ncbi:MAG TPA: hypothetical protein VGO48_15290 [Conexibacter sp.]|jgi:hypothetical protein|nr:hypothetical protein [Conexibacter sp.]
MTLFLAICLGIGLALAVGLRPFLPALLACTLARGDAGIDFEHTKVAFMEKPAFLFALLIGVVVLVVAERRYGPEHVSSGPFGAAVAGIGLALGALLFGGALQDHHYAFGIGLAAGIVCAALAEAAARGFFESTRRRLDREAAVALPFYAEGAGLVLAGLSVLVPPVALVALAFLVWLLLQQRRRAGQKYAGLRILR